MLADFIELGCRRVSFSLGGGSEALYPGRISIHAHQIWAGVYILTVVLNIWAGLFVREPLGLEGQEEALGERVSYCVNGINAMQPWKSAQVKGRLVK